MIVCIDRSRYWKGPCPATEAWNSFLEDLFSLRPARRPASSLEVLILSGALGCSEAVIDRFRTRPATRLFLMNPMSANPQIPTMPA